MMVIKYPYGKSLYPYLDVPDVAPLLDINFGFARARVLDTALELRLFTYVAEGVNTSAALATVTNSSVRGIERLLDALVGLDLLQRKHNVYSLRHLAAVYLVEEQPAYIGSHLRAVIEQWNMWSCLTEVVRSGRPMQDLGSPRMREYHPGMFAHLFPIVFPIAWQVAGQFDLPAEGRVLDLVAGSGAWGIAIALRHLQMEVVAQDEPALLQIAREKVEQFGLEGRFTFRMTGVDDLVLPCESFNLILVGHVCRFMGVQRTQALLRECYRLLKPGGCLLLADVMPNDERTGPPAALVIGVSLLLSTLEGDVFTASQYQNWLKATGFEHVKNIRVGQVPLLLALR
jgi:2-polyprenyl-3-methyl-5-hydroxy-6-metoxy-1,4-benzoquinol methylase